jgi:hypothetical protein
MSGILFATLFSQNLAAVEDEDLDLYTAEDLFNTCSVEPGMPEYIPTSMACRAFIGATVQYHDAVSDRKHMKRLICYPKGATVDDGREAFVAWGKRNLGNKQRMGEAAVVGLVRALAEKYPCRR